MLSAARLPKGAISGAVTTAAVAAIGIAGTVVFGHAVLAAPLVWQWLCASGLLNAFGWKWVSYQPNADREKAENAAAVSAIIGAIAFAMYVGATQPTLPSGSAPQAGPGLG